MTRVETLIIGAGVTGLAAAGRLVGSDYLVLEADDRIGGYCKTTIRDGFVWDHAGHFFHFRHPDTEALAPRPHGFPAHRERSRSWRKSRTGAG